MRSIPRSHALAGMVATVLAGCSGGISGIVPATGRSGAGSALAPDVLKIKVGSATKRIPANALRRIAAIAKTQTTQIEPGYTTATSDGNGIAVSADGTNVYDYDATGDLLIAHDGQQTGSNGMPIYRMTGTNGTEVQVQLPDLTTVPLDRTTTIGDFTLHQDSASQTATVSASIPDWGSMSVSVQPGSTGFTATANGGTALTFDYGLFGITQSQAAAMRARAPQGGVRRVEDFNPSATCLALIALLVALLLAAAYFGWTYIRLAYKLAAFAQNGLAIVNATLAKTLLITALTAVAGNVLGGAILKECFTGPQPPPPPAPPANPNPPAPGVPVAQPVPIKANPVQAQ